MEANEGRDLRDKGNVKAVTRNGSNLKKRFPKKPPKVLSDRSMIYLHANRLYHVLRLTDNRKLMFGRKRKDDDIYGKINKEL